MSKSNKILILGSSGLLGSHLVKLASLEAGLRRCFVVSSQKFQDPASLFKRLSATKPASIINCMGYKGKDPAQHFLVNACLPRIIADWCQKNKAFFLHISTNAVFPQDQDKQWFPRDPLGPETAYEVSKAFGEDPRAYVIRASFVGRSHKREEILDRLYAGEPYYDRRWNGVTALSLARRLIEITRRYAGSSVSAVEHVYSSSVSSFSQIAKVVGSKSVCAGKRHDARLLGGGVEFPPIEKQLDEYRMFLKRF